MFPMKSPLSEFWNILLGQNLDELVIDLTAISTRRLITLSIAVKIGSFMRFSTAMTALSTAFLFFCQNYFLRPGFDMHGFHHQKFPPAR